MRSLKQTLILWVVASVVVLTLVAGVSFYFLARAYLIERFDDELEERFELIASMLEIEDGKVDTEFDDLEMEEFEGEDEEDDQDDDEDDDEEDDEDPLGYLLITDATGVVYRSPTLGDNGTLPMEVTEDPVWVDLPGGRRGRVYTQRFVPEPDLGDVFFEWVQSGMSLGDYGEGKAVVLSIARDTIEVESALSVLGPGLAAAGGLLAVIMSGVVAYGVRRALRPVDALTGRLAAMSDDALGQPIEAVPVPTELEPIVAEYNALLARLGRAYERERGFSADAAHELRTPLAGLRTTLEVALAKPRSPTESAEVFEELQEVTEHMRILVEALLKLAELDAGRTDDELGVVHLDDEVERIWRLVRSNGVSHRAFETRLELHADAPMTTRPALLETVLRNVLHNAAEYVDEQGTITLATADQEDTLQIRVSNTGSTVTNDDAAHVFDRFWRADAARSGTGKHNGLGLALTRSAVHALGGVIRARSELGGTFTAEIVLPRVLAPTSA